MTSPRLLLTGAFAALTVAACGNSPPVTGPVAGPSSSIDGTRLIARSYSFPGTEPLFVNVYDKEEKTACSFRTARDGKLRCMPEYVDPALDTTPEHWVEGTEQPGDEQTPRLRSNHVASADGGLFPNRVSGELYDAEGAWACNPVPRSKDQPFDARCLPHYAGGTGFFFADASCSEALAATYVVGDPPLMIVLPDGALHAAGGVFTASPFAKVGADCTALEQPVDGLVRVGAALPEDAVTPVEIAARGTGRLALRRLETGGHALGTVSFSERSVPGTGVKGPYRDNTLGIDCYPHGVLAGAGEVRCVPSDAEIIPTGSLMNYEDPACTRPVVNTTLLTVVMTFRGYVDKVHRLGDYSKTAYTWVGGSCTEYRKGTGRVLLEEVPITTYAKLEPTMGIGPTY
jgi:hypothetical protein